MAGQVRDLEGQLSAEAWALFRDPPAAGAPASRGAYHHGKAGDVAQGTRVDVWLRLCDGRVADARFETFGCPASIAAAAWVARYARAREVSRLEELTGAAVAQRLNLPAAKTGVALVVEDALRAALAEEHPDEETSL